MVLFILVEGSLQRTSFQNKSLPPRIVGEALAVLVGRYVVIGLSLA